MNLSVVTDLQIRTYMHKWTFMFLYTDDLFTIMPVIRCNSFDPLLWQYVTDNARLRKIGRCEALQEIVKEHMRFVAMEYQKKETQRNAKKTKK